jgi:hypothetical protein
MADDLHFRQTAEKSMALSWQQEQTALVNMWQEQDHEIVRSACHEAFRVGDRNAPSKDGVQIVLPPLESDKRWQKMESTWMFLKNGSGFNLAGALQSVVLELDAPHLRPTSIIARMREGTALACHSLASLMVRYLSRFSV